MPVAIGTSSDTHGSLSCNIRMVGSAVGIPRCYKKCFGINTMISFLYNIQTSANHRLVLLDRLL